MQAAMMGFYRHFLRSLSVSLQKSAQQLWTLYDCCLSLKLKAHSVS